MASALPLPLALALALAAGVSTTALAAKPSHELVVAMFDRVEDRTLADSSGRSHGTVRILHARLADGRAIEAAMAPDFVAPVGFSKGARGALWLAAQDGAFTRAHGFFSQSVLAKGTSQEFTRGATTACIGARTGSGKKDEVTCGSGKTRRFYWFDDSPAPTQRGVWLHTAPESRVYFVDASLQRCRAVAAGAGDMFSGLPAPCTELGDASFALPEIQTAERQRFKGLTARATIDAVGDDHIVFHGSSTQRWKMSTRPAALGLKPGWQGTLVLTTEGPLAARGAVSRDGTAHALAGTGLEGLHVGTIKAMRQEQSIVIGQDGKPVVDKQTGETLRLPRLTVVTIQAAGGLHEVDVTNQKLDASKVSEGAPVVLVRADGRSRLFHRDRSGDLRPLVSNDVEDCFITTAVVRHRGLPDDGPLLTTLRELRDGPLRDHPDVRAYPRIAPAIVRRVRASIWADQIWEAIYVDYLLPAAAHARAGRTDAAHRTYRDMVRALCAGLGVDDGEQSDC